MQLQIFLSIRLISTLKVDPEKVPSQCMWRRGSRLDIDLRIMLSPAEYLIKLLTIWIALPSYIKLS